MNAGASVPALRLNTLSVGSVEESLARIVTLVVAGEERVIWGAFDFAIVMSNISSTSVSLSSVITMAAV